MDKEKKRLPALLRAAVTGPCILALAQTAMAGTLRLAPVRVEVAPNKQYCSLSLSNDGTAPAIVQIRGYGWTRDKEGNDLLDRANGPVVNPAIVTIPMGETRLIRCSLPNHAGPVEESYRLIIDELPGADPAPGTVKTLLRLSVPLFRPPVGAAPAVGWSVEKTSGGATRLLLTNRGNRHAQISAIILHPRAPQAAPVRVARGFYLLAGGETRLPLPSPSADDIATVELETAQGHLDASPLAPARASD